jgi:hypothetical protein
MGTVLRFLRSLVKRLRCEHEDIRRAAGGRMWLECLKCGRETKGIVIAINSVDQPSDKHAEIRIGLPRN